MADTLTSTPLNIPKAHAQSDSRPSQSARAVNADSDIKPNVKLPSPAPLVKATPAPRQPNTATINKPTVNKPKARQTTASPTTTNKASASKPAANTAKSAKPRDVKTRDAKTLDAKTKEKQLTVQEQLTKFEARVKRNNNAARKSIKELETLVDAIDAQSKTDRKSSKAALTRQINALNKKFTSMMAQSQAEIALKLTNDLAAYVKPNMAQGHNPNQYEVLSQVEIALDRANHRLSQSERAQSEAITKVNRHLADMALAIEARFEQNNNDQSKTLTALTRQITSAVDVKITAVKTELQSEFSEKLDRHDVTNKDNKADWERVTQDVTQLSQKVTGLETETTKTLQEIDTKFESMNAGISKQIDEQQADTDKQISDQLEQLKTFTQSELKIFHTDQNSRLEHMHDLITNINTQKNESYEKYTEFEKDITALQDRLNSVETYLNALSNEAVQANQEPASPEISGSQNAISPEAQAPSLAAANIVPIHNDLMPAGSGASQNGAYDEADRISHSQPVLMQEGSAALAPQYALDAGPPTTHGQNINGQNISGQNLNAQLMHGQAVQAQNYMPNPQGDIIQGDIVHAAHDQTMQMQNYQAQPYSAPNPTQNSASGPVPYVEPSQPYADPAYAESNTIEPIGAMKNKLTGKDNSKRSKSRKDKSSKGPIKLLLLGCALAVLGVFVGKMVLGSGDNFSALPSEFSENITKAVQQSNAPSPAITSVKDAAETGNAIAQYQLGLSHLKKSQSEPDEINKAVEYLRAAAAQNLPPAQYQLAKLYEDGRGVETDINQARQLTQRAAQSGHRIAMHDLALYYMDGRGGVNIDVNSAQQWFEQAAQHGVVDSQFNLAVLAESQKTPLRNLETAYFWYSIAAAQGDDAAKTRISAIAQNLSAEQISAAQSRIAAFKPKPIIAEVNGVFKDLPWDKASNAQKSAQHNSNTQNSGQAAQSVQIDNIRHVQKQLAALGYDIGQPDGAIGPRTLAAIKAFQKANDLPETGQINADLQGRLANIAGI